MKKIITALAAGLLFNLATHAQDKAVSKNWYADNTVSEIIRSSSVPVVRYDVRGKYLHPVTKEKLHEIEFVSDLIAGYPLNWVSDYVTITVSARCNGKSMKAVSANDKITPEQKNILESMDMGTDMLITISYRHMNPATDKLDIRTLNYSITLIPETEATYVGGYQQLREFLNKTVINKISAAPLKDFRSLVTFTISENGDIINVKLAKTTGDEDTDRLLMEAISKMPKWKPAENSGGIRVKQEFEFRVESGNSGC